MDDKLGVAGGFRVVVADPPWPFKNRGTRGAAEDHYSTMTMRDILRLPVDRVMAQDAILFMWVTDTHLFTVPFDASDVIRAWGFEPKVTIEWLKIKDGKPQMGLGNYVRHAHETCVIATRGGAAGLIEDKSILSFFWAPRGEHSEKPEELQTIVEKLVEAGDGERLELFARRQRPGWVCVGDDMPGALPRSVERFLGIDGPLGVLDGLPNLSNLEVLAAAGVGGRVTAHVENGEVRSYVAAGYAGGNAERAQLEDIVRRENDRTFLTNLAAFIHQEAARRRETQPFGDPRDAIELEEQVFARLVDLGVSYDQRGQQNVEYDWGQRAALVDRLIGEVTTSLDDPNYEDPDPDGADDPELEMGRK